MLNHEQTTIRRLDSEIHVLKLENEKLRTYKKEVQASILVLLKYIVPHVPIGYRSKVKEQIAELDGVLNAEVTGLRRSFGEGPVD